jgi:hypothetical protein
MGAGRALRSMGLTRRRIAVAAGVAVLLIAGISVILAAPGHSQAVQDGAVAALLVAAAGTVVVLVRQPGKGGPDLAALVTTGLAGAALATLLPQTQAYLIGYLALAGLGLRAPLRPWAAVASAVAVFAAMNAGYLLSCGQRRALAPRRRRWPSGPGWPGRYMTSWPMPCPG